jgi:hypothetical protein
LRLDLGNTYYGFVDVNMKNGGNTPIKPNVSIIFYDERYTITDCVHITSITTINAGESRSERQPFWPNSGPAVYYALSFKGAVSSPESSVPPAQAKVVIGQDENARELSRIERAFANTGISQSKREEIFRALCDAEMRAIREGQRLYPMEERWEENLRYHDRMTEKYEKQVYEKYHINERQADMISLEAFLRHWPTR